MVQVDFGLINLSLGHIFFIFSVLMTIFGFNIDAVFLSFVITFNISQVLYGFYRFFFVLSHCLSIRLVGHLPLSDHTSI